MTELLKEPIAVAYAYGHYKQNILVLNFGGSTFDASIVSSIKDKYEVIAYSGAKHLGEENYIKRLL